MIEMVPISKDYGSCKWSGWLQQRSHPQRSTTVTYCRTLKLRHITFHRQQRCELHIERLYRGDGAKQLKLAKTHTVSISRRGVILSPSDNILNWWEQNMSLNCIGTFQTRLKIKMYESRIILGCIYMLSSKAEFGQWPKFLLNLQRGHCKIRTLRSEDFIWTLA